MKKSIKLKDLYPLIQSILPICQKIHDNGGICYLVGGTVRDLVMHQAGYEVVLPKKNNDIDIEIHNLSLASIEKIFEAFGSVYTIGRRFGVLRVDSFNVDWSLPRTDSVGRKPLVTIDPFLPIEKA